MGSLSIWHWIIVIAIVLVLFGGRRRISALLNDFAVGINTFRREAQPDAYQTSLWLWAMIAVLAAGAAVAALSRLGTG